MPVDGPEALVQAERALPLVQPASQQASSVVKQWQEDLGAAAAATQPTPQHHLAKINQRVDIEIPVEQPQESAVTDKVPHEPDRANQLEAQSLVRQMVLDRAKRRKPQRPGVPGKDEDGEDEQQEASQRSSSRRSGGEEGPVSAV